MKAGYELIRTRYNATAGALPGGTYNFGGTQAPFVPNTGNTFASFLLGTVTSATFTQEFATLAAALVVAPVVCAGRLEAAAGPDHQSRPALVVRIAVPDQVRAAIAIRPHCEGPGERAAGRHRASAPGRLPKKDLNNFAPRLGLAWNFHPKWVFRGSFGVVHQDIFATGTEHHVPGISGDGHAAGARRRPAARLPPVARAAASFSMCGSPTARCRSSGPTIPAARQAGGIPTCGCRT